MTTRSTSSLSTAMLNCHVSSASSSLALHTHEHNMMARPRFSRFIFNASALTVALAAAWPAFAADTSFQSPVGAADAPPISRVLNEGAYAANALVARVVVEVDADGLPADGQTASKITVRLFDKNDRPLSGDALITIEEIGRAHV